MKRYFRILAIATGTLMPVAILHSAKAMPDGAKQETIRLIDSIGSSGCEFERNGEWFKAENAMVHLKRKLNATESRLQTTEQFIIHVASSSSVSGKPYRLRCNGGVPEDARPWLEEKLVILRGK